MLLLNAHICSQQMSQRSNFTACGFSSACSSFGAQLVPPRTNLFPYDNTAAMHTCPANVSIQLHTAVCKQTWNSDGFINMVLGMNY